MTRHNFRSKLLLISTSLYRQMSPFLQEDGGDAAQLPVQAGGGGGGHRLLLLPQHRRGVHRYLQVILFFLCYNTIQENV